MWWIWILPWLLFLACLAGLGFTYARWRHRPPEEIGPVGRRDELRDVGAGWR